MNHIQGRMTVWICYWHALEKWCLLQGLRRAGRAPGLLQASLCRRLQSGIKLAQSLLTFNSLKDPCMWCRILTCVNLWLKIWNSRLKFAQTERGTLAVSAIKCPRFSRTSWLRNLHIWVHISTVWLTVGGARVTQPSRIILLIWTHVCKKITKI